MKLHVLLISKEFPPERHGGIGAFNLTLATHLVKQGHRVIVLTQTGPKYDAVFNAFQVSVVQDSANQLLGKWLQSYGQVHYARAVQAAALAILTQQQIDIIEAPSYRSEALYLSRVTTGVPLVIRLHGLMARRPIDPTISRLVKRLDSGGGRLRAMARFAFHAVNDPLTWRIERSQLELADHLIAPSQFMARFVGALLPSVKRKMSVIHNAIETVDTSVPNRKDLWQWYCDHLSGHPTDRIVLFVGRVSTAKGADLLAQTAPEILNAIPEARFIFAGSIVEQQIVQWVRQRDDIPQRRVMFTGALPRTDLYRLYALSQFVTIPTLFETSSMASLEAMSMGKPVVSTRIGPLPEIVEDQVTGFLIPPRDQVALQKTLLFALRSPEMLKIMGVRAREVAKTRFSIEVSSASTANLYQNLILELSRKS